MAPLELFPTECVAGVFRGFREGGLEFRADLVLPYRNDFQNRPMHGQFLLVELETPDEAVLGRITAFSAEGRLASGSGEDFTVRAVQEHRPIPEDLRIDYLRYRVAIRMLGVLRIDRAPRVKDPLPFGASHRRLPHVGSRVAFPSDEVLQHIAGHHVKGAHIGYFALGEYIHARRDAGGRPGNDAPAPDMTWEPFMQARSPEVRVHFPVESLVARRSFIFARAGFGKSNLNKLLFSTLYETTPTVEKRGGRRVPVGTVLFDPDGEYFWPDDKGRPGLADVPHLRDQLVVFTNRQEPSPFYGSFVAGGIRLDIRRFRAEDIVRVVLSPERQEHQNVRKLAGLRQERWGRLVDLIYQDGNEADIAHIRELLGLDDRQDIEALAARSNMVTIVRMLHDPSSQLVDLLLEALGKGKLCVVDVSQLRGAAAMALSGLILRRIFEHNQQEFTKATPDTIPTIAVIEEAQSVLNNRSLSAEPFIEWVKEGRKYDLGAVMVTQQPGSIPTEILSQGDNWFLFHLLSAADLVAVQRANAHFSDDLLAVLLNEPIIGQGVFWSSVHSKPYPISLRVRSFDQRYQALDPGYRTEAAATYAARLRARAAPIPTTALDSVSGNGAPVPDDVDNEPGGEGRIDIRNVWCDRAVVHLRTHEPNLLTQLQRGPVRWARVQLAIKDALPDLGPDGERFQTAFGLVPGVMTAIFGAKGVGWHSLQHGNPPKTHMQSLHPPFWDVSPETAHEEPVVPTAPAPVPNLGAQTGRRDAGTPSPAPRWPPPAPRLP